jgi:hypothetical protein
MADLSSQTGGERAPPKYHYLRYNVHGVLRPNWAITLGLVFLARHVLLLLVIGLSHGRGGGEGVPQLALFLDPAFMISDLPALVLLVAMLHRRPQAGPLTRAIWAHGRLLILAAVGLWAAILAYLRGFDFARYDEAIWAMIAINVALVAYTALSPYVRDLFAGFPAPTAAPAGRV